MSEFEPMSEEAQEALLQNKLAWHWEPNDHPDRMRSICGRDDAGNFWTVVEHDAFDGESSTPGGETRAFAGMLLVRPSHVYRLTPRLAEIAFKAGLLKLENTNETKC
jgi:hypothetical protein